MNVDTMTAATSEDRVQTVRWGRLAPLTGPAFLIFLIAAAITAQGTPSDHAPGKTVLSFFTAHQDALRVSNLLAALGVVFLVFFASQLRSHLRSRGGGAVSSALFGGAVVLAVGGAARAGIGWALATGHDKLDPGAAQALNVVFAGHYPAIVGIAVFMFAACIEILRTAALPRWLGWAALPIGVAAVAPPSLIPLIASGIWIATAGIVMYVGGSRAPHAVP